MTIEEIQEECKKRFPIGCEYKSANGHNIFILQNNSDTYRIVDFDKIYAHSGGELLYFDGEFAKLIKKNKQPKPKKDDLKPLVKLLKEIT